MIKLRDIIREASDDKIQVRGIGTYTYETLKKKVQNMASDLAKNAKRKKSPTNGIKAFAEMWNALTEYESNK